MNTLKDIFVAHPGAALTLSGLVLGIAFGWVVAVTNFCAMGAISDLALFGDGRRMRAWVMAAAVATLLAQVLAGGGIVVLEQSMYAARHLDWFGHLAGGTAFGIGMVLAGGCTSRSLVRAGGGDLRAGIAVIVIAFASAMTMHGPLASTRAALAEATAIDLARFGLTGQTLGAIAHRMSGADVTLPLGMTLGCAAIAWCLASSAFRTSPMHVSSGLAIGLLVGAGWAATGLAYDDLVLQPQRPASLTFVRPAADTLAWLVQPHAWGWPGLGIASVLGTMLGATAHAAATGRFRWHGYADRDDAARGILGATLMGIGGVTAMGCTIGQGVTGLSTLALGAMLTFTALVAGGFVGVRLLQRWT